MPNNDIKAEHWVRALEFEEDKALETVNPRSNFVPSPETEIILATISRVRHIAQAIADEEQKEQTDE